jgi:hypothetical protein
MATKGVFPPATITIEGGRTWHRKTSGLDGYSTDDAKFDILQGVGYVVLVAFDHEPIDGYEFWRKRFTTLQEAMEYAEKM